MRGLVNAAPAQRQQQEAGVTCVSIRSTPPSRPNKVGLKCQSVRTYVRPSIRPQKASSSSMKFGM